MGKIYEDAFYQFELVKYAKKYVVTTKPYYYYFHSLPEKSMEKFGWINHQQKIFENWEQNVKDEDIVLIVGDISWAMKLEDAFADLAEIAKMKGQKILIKGNHDFWWQSLNKIKNYDENMFFMQNKIGRAHV